MTKNILSTWLEVDQQSDFSVYNIPFGIYSNKQVPHRVCSAIGDYIIDLYELAAEYFIEVDRNVLEAEFLNAFISLGKKTTTAVRTAIIKMLCDKDSPFASNQEMFNRVFKKMDAVKMLMPVRVGDYTDFYSSIDHATNVGTMFRDPANALLPNWKHLPVGYHGRASSICVSGHSFYRPKGQQKPADADKPVFGPTKMLDIELETAFIIGKETQPGDSISTAQADEYIFGMVLFNDWSARDIQTWEYVPLGPFLAKNFASTISPWVVTLEALEPFMTKGYKQEPEVLPYLQYKGDKNIDINLDVYLIPEGGKPSQLCSSNFRYMYWTMQQQLAHHTVNGCNVKIGDMMASGTISGPEPNEYGSMLELTWKGTKPIKLNDGSERKFVNDHDTIVIKGHCVKDHMRVGFGECRATVLPAKD